MTTIFGNSGVPVYIKICAVIVLMVTYFTALAIAVAVYIAHGPNATLPNVIAGVLGTGVGIAINAVGLHLGASIQANSEKKEKA